MSCVSYSTFGLAAKTSRVGPACDATGPWRFGAIYQPQDMIRILNGRFYCFTLPF